jgi:NitT/TauT family transport system substrate-binding protein
VLAEERKCFVFSIRGNRLLILALLAAGAMAGLAACGGGEGGESETTVRLGYFANVTHAPALVGLNEGMFEAELGEDVSLEPVAFNAGPAVIEALFAGEIDISYIGPNPAINGYVRSNGEALRIIAGSTSGGASLVVQGDGGIESPGDLAEKKVATPQLGNTQDVALRTWLGEHSLAAREQGGNVSVVPGANADTLTLFQKGEIDAAWVPEPWATRLVLQAGGRVLVDERDLWPDGRFVTTHVIVRTKFLEQHPDIVESFLRGHVAAIDRIHTDPGEAQRATNEEILEATTAALPQEVIEAAWEKMEFTYDPIASSLRESAAGAFELGFLGSDEPDLDGIYALDLLNGVLADLKLTAVQE